MRRGAVPCRCAFPLDFSLDAQTPYAVPTYDLTQRDGTTATLLHELSRRIRQAVRPSLFGVGSRECESEELHPVAHHLATVITPRFGFRQSKCAFCTFTVDNSVCVLHIHFQQQRRISTNTRRSRCHHKPTE